MTGTDAEIPYKLKHFRTLPIAKNADLTPPLRLDQYTAGRGKPADLTQPLPPPQLVPPRRSQGPQSDLLESCGTPRWRAETALLLFSNLDPFWLQKKHFGPKMGPLLVPKTGPKLVPLFAPFCENGIRLSYKSY
jgi:hypothetical protein